MLASSRVFSILKVLVALLVFTWTLSYLGFSPDYTRALLPFKGEKAVFVNDFLENEIDGPIDGTAIQELCANRTWTEGLIFACDPATGGVGKVRNAHLNCIRFAMEAGAEVVIPEIIRRSDKGKSRGATVDYFFDKQHLNWTLSTFCPQMKIYWSIDDLYNVPMPSPLGFTPDMLHMGLVYDSLMEKPWTFAEVFQDFFDEHTNPKTRVWPFRVNVGQTLFSWSVHYDTPAFVRNFGRIFRFRSDVRQLAASALYTLQSEWLGTHVDANATVVNHEGFVGVHLRTEKDVWDTGLPPYEEQAAYYFDFILQSPYRLAYLASGAKGQNITAFKERAQDFGITVLTKNDLLSADEQDYLSSLTIDQQALVDFELLLRSDLMAGISDSIFSWAVALRRAAFGGDVGGESMRPAEGHFRWQDNLSTIMGKEGKQINVQYGNWP
ncbi:hypothetical protein BX600DRAFT_431944 [Xylariales sp. PMI_506]|nr:hypothetical protein BX600DRAFT_431944 [Xylariales sp. PMI_506]